MISIPQLAFLFGVVFLLAQGAHIKCPKKGYYWQSSTGDLPENALNLRWGGQDLYIGQTYMSNPHFHGTIPEAVYTKYPDFNQNILCSKYKANFKWVPRDTAVTMRDKLVIGGTGQYGAVHIARKTHKGKKVIGPAITKDKQTGMIITETQETICTPDFEILMYDCPDEQDKYQSEENDDVY